MCGLVFKEIANKRAGENSYEILSYFVRIFKPRSGPRCGLRDNQDSITKYEILVYTITMFAVWTSFSKFRSLY